MDIVDNKIFIAAGVSLLVLGFIKGTDYLVDMFDQFATAAFDFLFSVFGLIGDLLSVIF